MAAVTVSEIEAAYNVLKAEGKETTARAVRARLGDRGSLGTINPVVSRLNAQNAGTAPAAPAPLTVDSIPQAVVDRANTSVLNLVGEIMQMANDNSDQRAGTYGNPRVKPPLSPSAARALPSAIEYCLRYFHGLYPANDGFYFTPATAKLNQRYFQLSAPVAKRLGFKVISNYKPGVFRGTYYVFIRI